MVGNGIGKTSATARCGSAEVSIVSFSYNQSDSIIKVGAPLGNVIPSSSLGRLGSDSGA